VRDQGLAQDRVQEPVLALVPVLVLALVLALAPVRLPLGNWQYCLPRVPGRLPAPHGNWRN